MSDTIQLEHNEFKSNSRVFPVTLICEDIKTPENVGMLFRLAEAFGVEHIMLCGNTATPPSSKIRKTARSSDKTVKWSYHDSIEKGIQQVAQSNYQIIALEITNNSTPLPQFKFKSKHPIALIIGSEAYGISESALRMSHAAIEVPMYGKNSSMNVATASAIALYEITNQLK